MSRVSEILIIFPELHRTLYFLNIAKGNESYGDNRKITYSTDWTDQRSSCRARLISISSASGKLLRQQSRHLLKPERPADKDWQLRNIGAPSLAGQTSNSVGPDNGLGYYYKYINLFFASVLHFNYNCFTMPRILKCIVANIASARQLLSAKIIAGLTQEKFAQAVDVQPRQRPTRSLRRFIPLQNGCDGTVKDGEMVCVASPSRFVMGKLMNLFGERFWMLKCGMMFRQFRMRFISCWMRS